MNNNEVDNLRAERDGLLQDLAAIKIKLQAAESNRDDAIGSRERIRLKYHQQDVIVRAAKRLEKADEKLEHLIEINDLSFYEARLAREQAIEDIIVAVRENKSK